MEGAPEPWRAGPIVEKTMANATDKCYVTNLQQWMLCWPREMHKHRNLSVSRAQQLLATQAKVLEQLSYGYFVSYINS
jgi:hypothetical protein